jgi:hypothetical protein
MGAVYIFHNSKHVVMYSYIQLLTCSCTNYFAVHAGNISSRTLHTDDEKRLVYRLMLQRNGHGKLKRGGHYSFVRCHVSVACRVGWWSGYGTMAFEVVGWTRSWTRGPKTVPGSRLYWTVYSSVELQSELLTMCFFSYRDWMLTCTFSASGIQLYIKLVHWQEKYL